ncbi:hypothetical protein ACPZ19_44250 [Amycolatopsis lurida]
MARLTARNPNPDSGEAHCRDAMALKRATEALRARPAQLQVRDLMVVVRRVEHIAQAEQFPAGTLTFDPLDIWALRLAGRPDDTAAALLGHWQHSAGLAPFDPVVWRNIAVASHNHRHDPQSATAAYEQATRQTPGDARLLSESDQLLKRIGEPVEVRLHRLQQFPSALIERDDLAVAYAQLLVPAGRAEEALAVLPNGRFQPWEGGEGLVLRAWERTSLSLAEQALARGGAAAAAGYVEAALNPPELLGETRHPLAVSAGDFAEMSPSAFSENTYFSILAARRLGESDHADELVTGLARHAEQLAKTPAVIDYFATSLPSLMLFDEDPQRRLDLTVTLLHGQLTPAGRRSRRRTAAPRRRARRRSRSRGRPETSSTSSKQPGARNE